MYSNFKMKMNELDKLILPGAAKENVNLQINKVLFKTIVSSLCATVFILNCSDAF